MHFRENLIGKWTPRSIFIDNDPTSIDTLLNSQFGELVDIGQAVSFD